MTKGWENLDGNGHYWSGQPGQMPPGYGPSPTDPLVSVDFSGWFGRGTALVRQVWKPALLLHAAVAVPIFALSVPAQSNLMREQEAVMETQRLLPDRTPPLGDLMLAVGLVFAVALAVCVLYLVATSATVQLTVQAATGRPISLGAAVRTGLRRAPALLGWALLSVPIALVAALLCVLPIFYVIAVLAVLPVVVTVERGEGIARCFQLFHTDLGVSVSRIATVYGITIGAGLSLGVLSIAISALTGPTVGAIVDAVLNALVTVAFGVAGTVFLVTAYADMRARREPFSTAHLTNV
ncbi:hypothetical protein [Actinoplanes sp. DH11]|uniref:hypothetical protein n=1 Tax=Actinoplanes sp. DH11 TaxID=2857011 RepID=UPI001E61970C|nr:hypothetical protein [Actinoplanes sp. DH11]